MITHKADLGAVILTVSIDSEKELRDNPDYFNEMIEIIKAIEVLNRTVHTIHE